MLRLHTCQVSSDAQRVSDPNVWVPQCCSHPLTTPALGSMLPIGLVSPHLAWKALTWGVPPNLNKDSSFASGFPSLGSGNGGGRRGSKLISTFAGGSR